MTLRQSLLVLDFESNLTKFRSNEMRIRVRMKGESPEAHADAILVYFNFSKSNEDTFKAKYGYDLRQSFIDTYKSGDQLTAHKAVGGGYFEVTIPLSQTLVAQIKSIKNPISSNLSNGNSNVSEGELRRPTPVPKNAAPAVQNFYRELDLFKTETLNFGLRMDKMADVRADYLKTIKYASNEFVEMVESGQISYEEGAIRANKLRNVLFEISRRKDWDLGRSIAEYFKPEARPFEWFLERYSKQRFSQQFSTLAESQRNEVFKDVVIAAGRDNKGISGVTPYLGKFGKVLLVASIAISVYNVATAKDKVNAAGREGSSLLGGFLGGAAGGAAAGLICGPGAPVCSAIGLFVGGAVGAFIAAGGYDWLTSK